jgi:hypothetical protein
VLTDQRGAAASPWLWAGAGAAAVAVIAGVVVTALIVANAGEPEFRGPLGHVTIGPTTGGP